VPAALAAASRLWGSGRTATPLGFHEVIGEAPDGGFLTREGIVLDPNTVGWNVGAHAARAFRNLREGRPPCDAVWRGVPYTCGTCATIERDYREREQSDADSGSDPR